MHDFRRYFLDAMVFDPWYWMPWFSVHGIGRNGFQSMELDASSCINMYCSIERNIMKNQAGSPGFRIQWENLCVYVFYMLSSHIVYFSVF